MQKTALYEQLQGGLPEIRGMGLMAFDPIWAQQMHESQECELLLVQRGRVQLVTEQKSYRFGANQFILIPPHTMHRDEFDLGEGLEVFIIFFEWSAAEAFFQQVSLDDLAGLELSPVGDTALLFQQLRSRPITLEPGDVLVLRSYLLSFLLSLGADVQRQRGRQEDGALADQRKKKLMQAACDYMARHYHQCVSLDDIAGALDISSYYLSHVFSEQAGFSLFAYLTNLRLQKACELLGQGRHNVSEAARAVGYDNANYFAKVFKKHFGCSPSQYAQNPQDR